MLVATTNWLYITLRRLNKTKEAEKYLKPIKDNLDIIENDSYYKLLKVYQGKIKRRRTAKRNRLKRKRSKRRFNRLRLGKLVFDQWRKRKSRKDFPPNYKRKSMVKFRLHRGRSGIGKIRVRGENCQSLDFFIYISEFTKRHYVKCLLDFKYPNSDKPVDLLFTEKLNVFNPN